MGVSLKVLVGYKGAGKTAFCTSLCWDGYLKGRKIFSNYKLEFPFTPIDLKAMIDDPNWVRDGIIAIDEAQTFVDCRMAGSKKNRLFSYIMLQGRKRKIDIILTTQQIENVDIRIRRNLEHLYECKALKKDMRDGKNVLRPATAEEIENQKVDLIRIEFTDYTMGNRKKMLFDPKPMFSKYDSDEFIDIIE
jgi:hypothetical protein